MGMISVMVRTHPATYRMMSECMPAGFTPSSWVREMVETLVAQPESSPRRRALRRLIEDPSCGRRLLLEVRSGPCKVRFRVQANHWDDLDFLAWSVGLRRALYLRRAMYLGGLCSISWYRYEKEAPCERCP